MTELKQTLTVWRGTGMMLNIVLGAGLLTLPGLAVQFIGDFAIWVWLTCAVAALPLLLVFALLGRLHPNSGGLAAVLKLAFGDFGYVAATFLFLGAVVFGLPAIALTGGHYAATITGLSPHALGIFLLLVAVGMNLFSAEHSAKLNAALASTLVFILLLVAFLGWQTVTPDLAAQLAVPSVFPDRQVFLATFMMVFFAFTGWEVSANLTGEFQNPNRTVPLAILLSFVLAVFLYGVLAVIVQGADLGGAYEAPFAAIFGQAYGPIGAHLISAVSVCLICANLSAAVWAVSRMVWSAAREQLLPPVLADLHDGTPRNAICITVGALLAVLCAAWAEVLNLGTLLSIAGQNFLLLYAASALALNRLSRSVPARTLSYICILIVVGLVSARGGFSLLYPLALIGFAGLVSAGRRRLFIFKSLGNRT